MRCRPLIATLAASVLALGAAPAAQAVVDPGPRAPLAEATASAAASVQRLAGSDRFSTAVTASRWAFDDAGGTYAAGAVVLSRSDSYADSLAAAPLAAAVEGPLLLTAPTSLRSSTEVEIDRLLNPGGTVYVLGGTPAVSTTVTDRLAAKGYVVKRLAGSDRYATAVAVAEELERVVGSLEGAAVTTGRNFPDGLAAGAGAGAYLEPVLLTNDAAMPAATKAFLDARPALQVAVVGAAAASAPYAFDDYLVGADRYATAAATADYYFGSPDNPAWAGTTVGVATGGDWPDALAASAMLALYQGPLLLTRKDALPAASENAVNTLETRRADADVDLGLVYGSTTVLTDAVKSRLATRLAQ